MTIPPRAPLPRVGSGVRYTDLERLRIEYWVRNTNMSVREMAEKLGRSRAALVNYIYRQGIWLREERAGEQEGSWAGV